MCRPMALEPPFIHLSLTFVDSSTAYSFGSPIGPQHAKLLNFPRPIVLTASLSINPIQTAADLEILIRSDRFYLLGLSICHRNHEEDYSHLA